MKRSTPPRKPKRKVPPQFLAYIKSKKRPMEEKAPVGKSVKAKPTKQAPGNDQFSVRCEKKHYSKI